MQFRHERRRRVFSDDAADVASGKSLPSADSAAAQAGKQDNSYTEAAQLARQRAVGTLLPARLLTIGLIVGGCLLLVGGCLSLDFGYPAMASWLPADDLAFLRLDAARSVGHWLASTLMTLAAALAVFIYSLRRHRIDDYHGRYRVWLWIGAACLVASLAETTGLGRLARALCGLAAESSSLRADVVWRAAFSLTVAAIAVRVFFEIRRSRWAVAALTVSALGFLVAAAAASTWAGPWTTAGAPVLARGSWLTGYVFFLASFLLYARHVQLEISGAIAAPLKQRRTKPDRQGAGKPQPAERLTSPSPAPQPQTDLQPVDAPTVDTPADLSHATESAGYAEVAPKSKKRLSKAERRQLRRDSRAAKTAS